MHFALVFNLFLLYLFVVFDTSTTGFKFEI